MGCIPTKIQSIHFSARCNRHLLAAIMLDTHGCHHGEAVKTLHVIWRTNRRSLNPLFGVRTAVSERNVDSFESSGPRMVHAENS